VEQHVDSTVPTSRAHAPVLVEPPVAEVPRCDATATRSVAVTSPRPDARSTDAAEGGSVLLRQSGYGLMARLVMAVSRGLGLVLISRALGPATFGGYSLLVASYSAVNGLATLGLDQAHVYSTGAERKVTAETLRNVLWLAATLGLAAAVLLVAVVAVLRDRIFDLVPMRAVALTALVFPGVLAHNIAGGMVLGRVWFRRNGIVEAGKWLFHLGLVVALAVTHHLTILSAVAALYVPILAAGAAYGVLLCRTDRVPVGALVGWPSWAKMRRSLHFGIRSGLANVTHVLHMRLDVYLLKYLCDAAVVGKYALAVSITDVVLYAGRSVSTVVFARHARERAARATETTAASRSILAVVGVATLVILFVAGPLVHALFGAQYEASVRAVQFRLPGLLAESGALILSGDFMARATLGPLLAANGFALSAGIVANLLLIPVGGMKAAAVVFAAASMLRYVILARAHARAGLLSGVEYLAVGRADWRRLLTAGRRQRPNTNGTP
jgi:O-antigen/teichoic acid export membrane protein